MGVHALLHHLTARWQRSGGEDLEIESEGAAAGRRGRQGHLAYLRRSGIPVWSEEPESCDACGRKLLIGERASLLTSGEELLLACPLCAERLLDGGMLPVPVASGRDGFEQIEIAS